MQLPRRLPVWGLLLPFAGGSCLGSQGFLCIQILPVLAFIGLSLLLLFVSLRKGKGPAGLLDLLFVGMFFLSGLASSNAARSRDPGLDLYGSILVLGEIRSTARLYDDQWYFDLDVFQVWTGDSILSLHTMLKVRLDTVHLGHIPGPGHTLILSGRPVALRSPRNPGEVNYKRIMQQRNCWYYLYASMGHIRSLPGHGHGSPRSGSAALRSKIYKHWEGPPEVIGLLKAICLGDRSAMDTHIREDYARAGGMHLLAVSGLHVGVIWWILHQLLFPLVRISGRELARCMWILSLLWCYAWLTGFSPSVSRSVTMFSLFSLSTLLNRRGPSLNILLVSMFLLLLVRPVWIMETGFQLSYVAVGAILRLHPLMTRIIRTRNPILRWFRDAAGISLAAQLGTLPLVVAYFARIPVYGVLTSILTLPMLSFLLAVFVLSLPFLALDAAAGMFARMLVCCGSWMNHVVQWVASLPSSVWGPVSLDRFSLPLCLILIFLIPELCGKKWRKSLLPLLLIFTALMLRSAQLQLSSRNTEQTVVPHIRNFTCISIRQGRYLDHYLWCREGIPHEPVKRYLEGAWPQRYYRHHILRMEQGLEARGSISRGMCLGEGMHVVGNTAARIWVLRAEQGEPLHALGSIEPPDLLVLSGAARMRVHSPDGSTCLTIPMVADASNPSWYLRDLLRQQGGIHTTVDKGAYILNH